MNVTKMANIISSSYDKPELFSGLDDLRSVFQPKQFTDSMTSAMNLAIKHNLSNEEIIILKEE